MHAYRIASCAIGLVVLAVVLLLPFVLNTQLDAMLLPRWTYMLSFASVGFAQSPPPGNRGIDISWYPSKPSEINNLTTVMAAEGVYGFVYNSSHVPDEIYGVYNWCNMPHVRKKEYVCAPDEYELVYVEVVSDVLATLVRS